MTGERWAVLLMDGSPAPSIHHAWHIDGDETTAEAFRAFVSDEIDPAIKVRLRDPLGELLSWRAQAEASYQAALREIPLPPGEIALLTARLCQSQPTEIAADLGVQLAMALDDWLSAGPKS